MIKFTPLCILLVLFTFYCPAMERMEEGYLTILTENGKGNSIRLTQEDAEKFPSMTLPQQNTLRPIPSMGLKVRQPEPLVQRFVDFVKDYPDIMVSRKNLNEDIQKELTQNIRDTIEQLSLQDAINMYDLAEQLGIGFKGETILAITLGKKIANDTHQFTQDKKDELTSDPNIKAKKDTIQFLLNIPTDYFRHITIKTGNVEIAIEYHIAQLSKLLFDQIKSSNDQEDITINLKNNFDQYTINTTINLVNTAYLEYERPILSTPVKNLKQKVRQIISSQSIEQLVSILNFLELLNIQMPDNYKNEEGKPLDAHQQRRLLKNLRQLRIEIEQQLISKINSIHIDPLKRKGLLQQFNPNAKAKQSLNQTILYIRENLNPTALKKLILTYPKDSPGYNLVRDYILPRTLTDFAKNLYTSLAEKAYTYRNHLAVAAIAGIGIAATYYKWLHQSQ